LGSLKRLKWVLIVQLRWSKSFHLDDSTKENTSLRQARPWAELFYHHSWAGALHRRPLQQRRALQQQVITPRLQASRPLPARENQLVEHLYRYQQLVTTVREHQHLVDALIQPLEPLLHSLLKLLNHPSQVQLRVAELAQLLSRNSKKRNARKP